MNADSDRATLTLHECLKVIKRLLCTVSNIINCTVAGYDVIVLFPLGGVASDSWIRNLKGQS